MTAVERKHRGGQGGTPVPPASPLHLRYFYSSHFNTECEPGGYLAFRTNTDIQVDDKSHRRFQHPRDLQEPDGRAFAKRISGFASGSGTGTVPTESSIDIPMAKADKLSIPDFALIVYQHVQSVTTSADDFEMSKPAERRIDELVIFPALCGLSDGAPTMVDGRWAVYTSPQQQFSIAIDLVSSTFNAGSGQEPVSWASLIMQDSSTPSVRHAKYGYADFVQPMSSKIAVAAKMRLQAAALLHSATKAACDFYEDRKFAWSSDLMRTFHNSYVDLPSGKRLPGIAFLHMYRKFGRDSIPVDFYEYHARLARERLPALDPLHNHLDAIRWTCDAVSWIVRAGAAYMTDAIDTCPIRRRTGGGDQIADSAPQAEFETKLVQDEADKAEAKGARLPSGVGGQAAKKHRFKATDQFKGLWESAFQIRLADDCESLFVAVYVLVVQLIKHLSSTTKLPPLVQQMTWLTRYLPVMLTCSIRPDSSSPKLICHVVMLLVPKRTLVGWIRTGKQIRSGSKPAPDQALNVDTKEPVVLIDATEYSPVLQLQRDLVDSGFDNDKTYAFVLDMRETFDKCGMFVVTSPNRLVKDYNLYEMATMGLCTETEESEGVAEFVFYDIKRRRCNVDMRTLMDCKQASSIACIPTRDPVTVAESRDKEREALDLVTRTEPFTALPAWFGSNKGGDVGADRRRPFYVMYARDIDWQLNAETFKKWFAKRHPTKTFAAERSVLFDDSSKAHVYHWIVSIYE